MKREETRGVREGAQRRRAANDRAIRLCRKNERIFRQGDQADAVFKIRRGRVKITVTSETGKEAVIAVFAPPDFFGESCLYREPVRLATATALTDCVVETIDKRLIGAAILESPSVLRDFITHLISRNARLECDLVDQIFSSSEKRLARTLLLLANSEKEGKPEIVVPRISQELLAEMVGTTRSRVSSFMNKFRKMGLVSYEGQTLKIRSELLKRFLHMHEA